MAITPQNKEGYLTNKGVAPQAKDLLKENKPTRNEMMQGGDHRDLKTEKTMGDRREVRDPKATGIDRGAKPTRTERIAPQATKPRS